MNNREFKEPGIPENLLAVEDAMAVLEEAKNQETGIIKRRFKGIFLTKFDGGAISFRQVVLKTAGLWDVDSMRQNLLMFVL